MQAPEQRQPTLFLVPSPACGTVYLAPWMVENVTRVRADDRTQDGIVARSFDAQEPKEGCTAALEQNHPELAEVASAYSSDNAEVEADSPGFDTQGQHGTQKPVVFDSLPKPFPSRPPTGVPTQSSFLPARQYFLPREFQIWTKRKRIFRFD